MTDLSFIFSIILMNTVSGGSQPVKSPDEFLDTGWAPGSHSINKVTEYCNMWQLTQALQNTKPTNNIRRPELGALIISNPENLSALEEIRKNNLIMAGFSKVFQPESSFQYMAFIQRSRK